MKKVSVIVPVYNGEKFISESLDSIINQTYKNLEVLCVDDLSTDNTKNIIDSYIQKDNRIKYFQLQEKGGASIARNVAIKNATGNYIAFLDADDIWVHDKLEKQLKFMENNNLDFTYTYFGFLDENSIKQTEYRLSPNNVTYKSLLYGNTLGCLTVIYNADNIGLIQIPRIDKRNDFALWLAVLKKVEKGILFPEILSYYRRTSTSLSQKDGKLNLIKYHIYLHSKIEGFSWIKTLYYTVFNIINTYTIKYKYTKRSN